MLPLKQDIKRIRRLIKRWNAIPRHQFPMLARGKFIAWDLGTVKDLNSELEGYQKRLVYVLQLVNLSESAAQSVQARADARQKVLDRAIENNNRNIREKKEELHRLQTERAQKRIFEALERIEKKEPNSVSRIARSGNAVSVENLEKTLIDNGLSPQEVKVHLEYFMAVLRRDSMTPLPPSAVPKINVQGNSNSLAAPINGGLSRHRSDAGLKPRGSSPASRSNNPRPLSSSSSPTNGTSGVHVPKPTTFPINNVPKPTTFQVNNQFSAATQLPARRMVIKDSANKKILCIDGSNGGEIFLFLDFTRTNQLQFVQS